MSDRWFKSTCDRYDRQVMTINLWQTFQTGDVNQPVMDMTDMWQQSTCDGYDTHVTTINLWWIWQLCDNNRSVTDMTDMWQQSLCDICLMSIINKSALTDHATTENHIIDSVGAKTIDKKPQRRTQQIKSHLSQKDKDNEQRKKQLRATPHVWWRHSSLVLN